MQRRDVLRALTVLALPGGLAACGGEGGSSETPVPPPPPPGGPAISSFTLDKASYNIGDPAVVTAVFSGGSASLSAPNMAVVSGTPINLPIVPAVPMRLTVGAGTAYVTKELTPGVAYRSRVQTMPMGFSRAGHVTAVGAFHRLYVVGGEGGVSSPPLDVMVFDPFTEKFSLAGTVATGRFGHTVTPLAGGASLLILGGSRTVSGAPIAEIFDTVTGKSRPVQNQPLANRQYHTATALPNGMIFIAGGRVAGNPDGSRTAEIFNPAAETFTPVASKMLYGREQHIALPVSGDRVLLYGGSRTSGYTAAEIFDVATSSFSVVASPETVARTAPKGISLRNGELLITGGEDEDGVPFQSLVRANADGSNLRLAGQLSSPRAMHSAAPLADGRALIAGGTVDSTSRAVADTDLFSGGAVAPGPQLAVGRIMHTADMLVTGKVLIIGGNDRNTGLVATAELYG